MVFKEDKEQFFQDALANIMVALDGLVELSANENLTLLQCYDVWENLCINLGREDLVMAFVAFQKLERNVDVKILREEDGK